MLQQIRLMLCFLRDVDSERELAEAYWELDSEGQWVYTVQKIAQGSGQPKHTVLKRVRRYATAYDLNDRCCECDIPRELTSRSDTATHAGFSSKYAEHGIGFVCADCRSAREREAELEEREKRRAEYARLRQLVRVYSDPEAFFDYSEIEYLDAIVAYGIMLHSHSAVENGLVGSPYELALCDNSLLREMLGRLFNHSVLIFGQDTPLDAIDPSSDEQNLQYYPLKVNWQFARPLMGETFSDAFRQLGSVIDMRSAHPQYHGAVSELWWKLAVDDSLRYLEDELDKYRLSGLRVGNKMREALLYALNRFSIPRLRYLLYRIAKNTAALAQRHDFVKAHALNTIPGSLVRDCDRAIADNWNFKPYCLKWDEEEARLIPLLFDRILGTGREGFQSTTGAVFQRESVV
jgi:hypothetical protein